MIIFDLSSRSRFFSFFFLSSLLFFFAANGLHAFLLFPVVP